MLEALERANLFVVALDEVRGWYRYHHLLAEALRSHLQQREPAIVSELHRRAIEAGNEGTRRVAVLWDIQVRLSQIAEILYATLGTIGE